MIKLSNEDKMHLARLIVDQLKPLIAPPATDAKETPLDTNAIMERLGLRTHPAFRKAVKDNNVQPVTMIGKRKYYLPSQFGL
ncbi:MAG: hypothetical protein EOP56_13370 [Sphingobacteriales bacterium]|nr:MAG: hypothetical protein EOP56_13370 [Sphingobacteriales bacterium]